MPIEDILTSRIPGKLYKKIEQIQYSNGENTELSKEDIGILREKLTLNEIGLLALRKRFQLNPGNIVTFLIDRNINYTNICVTECKFCAFYRLPGEQDSYVLNISDVSKKIEELLKIGGTRILLQGGHNPKLKLTYYTSLLSDIKKRFPTIKIDAFTPSEVEFISNLEKLEVEDVLLELKKAGLDGLPGGGAEILVDRIRDFVSPKKQSSQGWLEIMEIAHKIGLTTTATMVIGMGETFNERLEHLEKIRNLQKKSLLKSYKGFVSFIMWPAQHNNTRLTPVKYNSNFYTTPYDYLETLAISRLFLGNVQHIGASWPTMGEKIANVALYYGADDFGGTMLEENVVSQASVNYKISMLPDEIIENIKTSSFIPAQRDSDYRILKIFE